MAEEKIIQIGNPQDDGDLLISGFYRGMEYKGKLGRWLSKVAVMKLPVWPDIDNLLIMEALSIDDQKVHIVINGQEVGTITLTPGDWESYQIHLPAELCRDRDTVEMRIESEVELPRSREQRIKWYFHPMCLNISKLVIRADREKEALTSALPSSIEETPHYHVYWGDPHVHTNMSLCDVPASGSVDENYRYAREAVKLDFIAITDHAEDIFEDGWEFLKEKAEEYYEPGKFVTFPAYEWSSEFYGHRNIYFLNSDDAPLYDSVRLESDTPPKLWSYLEEKEVILIPHHPARLEYLFNWDYHHPKLEPLVEIFSKWGNSEYYGAPLQETTKVRPGSFVQDALARGYHLGFVAGSDGHVIKPGSRGLTAVIAEELTRESIFRAFQARRCYATTGARIYIEFRINGHQMGEIVPCTQYSMEKQYPLRVFAKVIGTTDLEKVELIENGRVIFSMDTSSHHGYIWKEVYQSHGPEAFQGRASRVIAFDQSIDVYYDPYFTARIGAYYYLRVTQTDRHMAWTSPIWFVLI